MAPRVEHELHRRRASRNLGLFGALAAFVLLVFLLTVAKVQQGDLMKAWDHHPDAALLPPAATAPAAGTTP